MLCPILGGAQEPGCLPALRWAAGSEDASAPVPSPPPVSPWQGSPEPAALVPQTYNFLHLTALNCIVGMLAECPESPRAPLSLVVLSVAFAASQTVAGVSLAAGIATCDEVPVTWDTPLTISFTLGCPLSDF